MYNRVDAGQRNGIQRIFHKYNLITEDAPTCSSASASRSDSACDTERNENMRKMQRSGRSHRPPREGSPASPASRGELPLQLKSQPVPHRIAPDPSASL